MKSLAKLFMTASVALLSAGACHAGTITINVWKYQWETIVYPIVYVNSGSSFNNNSVSNVYEFVGDSSQSVSDGAGAPNETENIHEYVGGPVNNPDPSFPTAFATNVNYLAWRGGITIPFGNGAYAVVNFPLSIPGTTVSEVQVPH